MTSLRINESQLFSNILALTSAICFASNCTKIFLLIFVHKENLGNSRWCRIIRLKQSSWQAINSLRNPAHTYTYRSNCAASTKLIEVEWWLFRGNQWLHQYIEIDIHLAGIRVTCKMIVRYIRLRCLVYSVSFDKTIWNLLKYDIHTPSVRFVFVDSLAWNRKNWPSEKCDTP